MSAESGSERVDLHPDCTRINGALLNIATAFRELRESLRSVTEERDRLKFELDKIVFQLPLTRPWELSDEALVRHAVEILQQWDPDRAPMVRLLRKVIVEERDRRREQDRIRVAAKIEEPSS